MALDSRADDLAWLSFNDRAFNNDALLHSESARFEAKSYLQYLPYKGKAAVVSDAEATYAQANKMETRKRVIQRAHELIGTPYSWGGTSETKGFDCSGLLVYLFRSEAGMEIPRTTVSMINEGYLSVSRRDLQPGDAVFFDNKGRGQVDHVGLYIGDNQFVHAPRTGTSIRIDSLGNQYWSQRYFGGRRFDENSST